MAIKNATSEDSDQTANAQADLDFRWELMAERAFTYVTARVI